MEIELDLDWIEKLYEERLRENYHFRYFLKGGRVPDEEIDRMVNELYRDISSAIDCTKCSKCCRIKQAGLDGEDIEILSQGIGISSDEFRRSYLEKGEEENLLYINKVPCPFLNEGYCSHYESRPKVCREYPHLDKGDFTIRMMGLIEEYPLCPIVFNVIEQLKIRLGYEYRER
jgi:Fe-S-cluster containining protein